MAWFVLVVAGLCEPIWVIALGRVDSVTRLGPIAVFLTFLTISLAGLSWAMRDLPTGVAYAVWVAIGAVATVALSVALGEEHLTVLKVVFLVVIIGGVAGLKAVS
ncbi:multidrug efflux SMR transporter [Corynebacterium variabile]|uniref:DMT family transporter n=1 Tax=Corynebacterium variabile TaxID=1727 RepID=UPI0028ABC367|nr:multidrug efflux SMR transporter [Corynebacterium variabile]